MGKFRVAITDDMLKADGTPAFEGLDLSPLEGPDVEHFFVPAPGSGVPAEAIEDADALILLLPPFGAASIPANGRLALVARFGVGYDSVDVAACTARHVALVNTPQAVRRPVSVMALTFIFALSQHLLVKNTLGHGGPDGWARRVNYMGSGLVGRTVGIVGFGGIARELVTVAKPFGMKFIAHDPYVTAPDAAAFGVDLVDKETLFRESDFVVVLCLLNDGTRGLVDAQALGWMKKSAYLVNVARGPIVDQKALTAALNERRIAGAALDVLEKEPPDANDPILACDNAIITPHALCWTDQTFAAIGRNDVDAVLAVMHGRLPDGLVNRAIADDPTWRAKLDGFRARFGG